MTTDLYDNLAEFHDVFMEEPWEALRPAAREMVGGLGPEDVVVDLDAGTGVGTQVLAAVTAAKVVAIEPSRMMRTALMARVAGDQDLAERVTVVAGGLLDALGTCVGEQPVAGFVCAHTLGHLDEATRKTTFNWLATYSTPDVAGLVTFTPDVLAEGPVVERRRLGRYLYEAHYLESPGTDSFLSEYVVKDRDRVIRSERFAGPWLSLPSDRLAEELAGAGFTLTVAGPSWGLVRKDAR